MGKSYSEYYISPESKAQEKLEGEKVDKMMFSCHHLPRGFRVFIPKAESGPGMCWLEAQNSRLSLGASYGYVRPCLKPKQMSSLNTAHPQLPPPHTREWQKRAFVSLALVPGNHRYSFIQSHTRFIHSAVGTFTLPEHLACL